MGNPEYIVSHRQRQLTIAVICPYFSVRILCHDGHAGEILYGIQLAAIGKADSILCAAECLFIFPNRLIQIIGQHSCVIITGTHKIFLCGVIFGLSSLLNIRFFFLIVRHSGHQLKQATARLAAAHIFTETKMGYGRSRDRQIVVTILVTAGIVSGDIIDGGDQTLAHAGKGMATVFQCFAQSLALCVGNIFRCNDQFTTGFRNQDESSCRFYSLRLGRQYANHQQTAEQQAQKPQSLSYIHRAFSFLSTSTGPT